MAKIKAITEYKGHRCAELDNGEYILQDNIFELIRCEKVPEGMKIIESGIIGGIMIRNDNDFRWCVENMK